MTAAATKPRVSEEARSRNGALSDRVLLIGAGILVLYTLLAVRLCYLQLFRHQEFLEVARQQRDRAITIPARRGLLLDRNGTLLVRNEPSVDIVIDPNAWHHLNGPASGDTPDERQQKALTRLAQLAPGIDVAGAVAKHGIVYLPNKKRWRPFTIAEKVDAGIGKAIAAEQKQPGSALSGIGILPSFRRVAIDGALAPHVIGFTGRDGKGLDGIEHGLQSALTGEDGILAAEFDVRKHTIPGTIRADRPAQNGKDVVLTLDAGVQNIVQNALEAAYTRTQAEAATAVVLDPKTGDILACANYPSYDVNHPAVPDPAVRVNRAVSTPYEPGSTLKIFTVGAALEEKKVTPETHFFCNGFHPIGKRTIHCHLDNAFPHGHGDETLEDVIVHSCNVATAECASLLGKNKLYEYETKFGFGAKTHSGLPGESRGLLTPGDDWSDIQLANVAFGQGIAVTPLQLAAAYGAIANDGIYHKPRIVRGVRDDSSKIALDPPDEGRRVISSDTARELRHMLQAVVDRGTGRIAALDGYTAGGKTGTAQIAEKGHYSGKFVASFIGMAPMTNPRYVVLVAVTNPKGNHMGAFVSAPVFREITQNLLLTERVPHDRAITPKSKMSQDEARITHDD